jgi:hypothetical protein
MRLTQEFVEQKINERCIEKNYKLVEPFIYKNCYTKFKLKCEIDNYEWSVTYTNFINKKRGCPKCSGGLKLTQKDAEFNVNKRCDEMNHTLIEPFIYKNNKTKIHLKCNKDNYEWYVKYDNYIISKTGCSKCSGNLNLTQKDVECIINERCNQMNYTIIEPFTYKNNKTKIHLKCNKDNHEWYVSYSNFINSKKGCPKCSGGLKLIQKDVEEIINEKCKEKNYELLEEFIYSSNTTKIHLKCNKDNYEWHVSYNNFINNDQGCPKCGGNAKLTQEYVETCILKKCQERGYQLVESFNYLNSKSKFYLKCNICNHYWHTTYSRFITQDHNCYICGHKFNLINEEVVKENILNKCKKDNLMLINDFKYVGREKTKISLKSNICGHVWTTTYSCLIYYDTGCPKCRGERIIQSMIKKYGEIWLKHIPKFNPNSIIYLDLISEKLRLTIQHALNGGEKKFVRYWVDGYIEKYNICIEWHEKHHNWNRYKKSDVKKEKYIKENFHCHYIIIWEKEFLKDVENQINLVVEKINKIIDNIKN